MVEPISYGELKECARKLSIDESLITQLFERLIREGYIKRLDALSGDFTLLGKAVDKVLDINTGHDSALQQTVLNTITLHNSNAGVIQTGSHNNANVAQQFNPPASEFAKLITELRQAAGELPTGKREEALELIDAVESEAQSKKPKQALVKACAEKLNAYLLAYGPTIATLVELLKSAS